jgi:signal transduction histidine kinase
MEGENEWTESTLRQVDHMNDLIKNLVMLSRSEEMVDRSSMTEINVTDTISETVETFRPVAIQAGKTLTVSIRDEIRMITDRDMIEQLTSLLIDNAIKYCDDDGVVEVNASQKGRGLRLVVSNTYANGKGQDYSRFFDRFYRADASRSEQKKGYGIGLSIAQNIVQLNKGSINASWKDGVISFTCVIP